MLPMPYAYVVRSIRCHATVLAHSPVFVHGTDKAVPYELANSKKSVNWILALKSNLREVLVNSGSIDGIMQIQALKIPIIDMLFILNLLHHQRWERILHCQDECQ